MSHRVPGLILALAIAINASTAWASPNKLVGPNAVLDLLEPGRTVLLGEIHGTQEMPRLAGNIIETATNANIPLIVALEYPTDTESALSHYLLSDGGDSARQTLLQSAFPADRFLDGRRSQAMLAFFERLRRLHANGADLMLKTLDPVHDRNGEEREAGMARNLIHIAESNPDRAILAITGNFHSRTETGYPPRPGFDPMGHRVAAKLDDVVSVLIRHTGGSAWACTGPDDCGTQQLRTIHGERPPAGTLRRKPDDHHDYTYWIGEISASKPARPE